MRVCIITGCPNIATTGGRCPTHATAHNRARGTPTQRGYGATHRRQRAAWQRRLDAGEPITCWRCGQPITPDQPWDLGHDDTYRDRTRGPEHQYCNRAAGGRAAH